MPGETGMRAAVAWRARTQGEAPHARASHRTLTAKSVGQDYDIIWIVACEIWFMVVNALALAW